MLIKYDAILDDARERDIIADTKANILAMTPILGSCAFATDTLQAYVANGTAWNESPFALYPESANPDMGADQTSSRIGYHIDNINNKSLTQCKIGSNNNAVEGAIRTSSGYFQIYLNGAWNNIVVGFRFREHAPNLYALEHMPIGFNTWIDVLSGNSVDLDMLGKPIVQNYRTSMGAYQPDLIINCGTYT